MTRQSEHIRRSLLESSPEFRRLADDHARYGAQLEALAHKRQLTSDDQAEIARLKKLKLKAKDRMQEMIRDYRREQAEAVQAT